MTGNEELKEEERQSCEVWTRVMGYYRPISEYNHGKKSEFYARVCFSEAKAVHSTPQVCDGAERASLLMK